MLRRAVPRRALVPAPPRSPSSHLTTLLQPPKIALWDLLIPLPFLVLPVVLKPHLPHLIPPLLALPADVLIARVPERFYGGSWSRSKPEATPTRREILIRGLPLMPMLVHDVDVNDQEMSDLLGCSCDRCFPRSLWSETR